MNCNPCACAAQICVQNATPSSQNHSGSSLLLAHVFCCGKMLFRKSSSVPPVLFFGRLEGQYRCGVVIIMAATSWRDASVIHDLGAKEEQF